ncbi:tautomerase family protein [Pelagibacteraceae bacterium]|jgi:phenylpyruvate tautomerase PptA (4-oxalocrotonate tautomerase family)|nr:tautomerase family protein [Pelagibacteraceae bacterium]
MPTYTVKTSNLKLKNSTRNKIAKGITQAHNEITGANSYFAQVIFQENKINSHFMGGKLVKDEQIFLQGQIRAGRSIETKNRLIIALRDTIIKNSKVKKDNVWVYLLDLTPQQMIEYGEVLPKSGDEIKWFNSLSKTLQKKLRKIDR